MVAPLWSMLGAVAALAVLLVDAGCTNPQCWTGGSASEGPECTSTPRSSSSGPSYDPESAVRNSKRQLADYRPRCAAGEATACWMVGEAQIDLKEPIAEAEASFAAACRGGLGPMPGTDQGVCGRAGTLAEQPGGSGTSAAREFYQLGCERGARQDCDDLLRLMPAPPLALAVTACRQGVGRACVHGAAMARASGQPVLVRALTLRGCRASVDELCIALGRLEVGR